MKQSYIANQGGHHITDPSLIGNMSESRLAQPQQSAGQPVFSSYLNAALPASMIACQPLLLCSIRLFFSPSLFLCANPSWCQFRIKMKRKSGQSGQSETSSNAKGQNPSGSAPSTSKSTPRLNKNTSSPSRRQASPSQSHNHKTLPNQEAAAAEERPHNRPISPGKATVFDERVVHTAPTRDFIYHGRVENMEALARDITDEAASPVESGGSDDGGKETPPRMVEWGGPVQGSWLASAKEVSVVRHKAATTQG